MSKSTTIRLGDWTATPELNLLERDGCSSKLEPRTMDLLVYLANRAGEVVTTHEVMAQVWRGRVVEDSAVYKRINQLRKALGDDSRAPTFIETIPKRGYRLIAPVDSGSPETPQSPQLASTPVAKGQRARSLKLAAGLIGIALVAIASIYYAMREDAAQSVDPPVAQGAGRPDLPSIAALPLANIGPNEEHAAFFADGLHAELLTQLSKITSLRVIAATSVIEYAERQTSVSEVAQELGVSAVLKGTVQRVAHDLRVNVQLISHDNEQLWAERYDRRLTAKNLFDIQSEIATSIAAILNANVNAAELAQLQGPPTQSTQAYNFYLKGVGYALRPEVWANIPLARQQLELAVEKDPEFALAWAWLARVYVNMHRMQDILEPSDAWADMALAATRRALALDPDLPQAHIAMAAYHLNVSFDVQEALREATIAAAGMPGDSLPIVLRGQVHRRLQQWSQAVAALERAVELDPRNHEPLGHLSAAHLYQRQYGPAEVYADRALAISPDDDQLLMLKATIAFARNGDMSFAKQLAGGQLLDREFRLIYGWQSAMHERDYDLALDFLDRMEPTNPAYMTRPIGLWYGLTYEKAGSEELAREQFELARAQLEEALGKRPDDPRLLVELAATLPSLGEAERAVALAQQAVALAQQPTAHLPREYLVDAIHWVYLRAGAFDEAIEALDVYLAEPGTLSVEAVAASPMFDPIHSDPRFQVLLEKYGRQ